MIYHGKWHGPERYFGLHYDLHAGANDTELGTRCGPDELIPMLELMGPDFVQTDCKGHPGYTSWFSQTPEASVPPGLKQDALAQWREATRKLGLPLHCHYSGIWDQAAGKKHPEWSVVTADGQRGGAPFGQNAGAATPETMCPRSAYLDELMIPQMLELIDRYEVDGFWIDGDLWAVQPCYCDKCRAAFTAETGIANPPATVEEPGWAAWWNFTRRSFYAFVTRYCDAVHEHKPGVLVCSNWLQTFRNPGEPAVPTDWISGDNAWVWGLDGSRCEARFLSTRGKPWDIMLWNFYCSHEMGKPDSPWTVKPPQMLMQEAAALLSFGGNVQIYEHPPVRDGRLVPWRQEQLGEVGRFVKARREVCQATTTIPQIAVLHSEHHLFSKPTGKNLMGDIDFSPVQGAVFALLENSFGVDILDEWALLQRLPEFPVVVVPEQHNLSEEMVIALQAYVDSGGRLLLTGLETIQRFPSEFIGASVAATEKEKAYALPAGKGSVPLYSATWGMLKAESAETVGQIGHGSMLRDKLLPHPAAVINESGSGRVACVPANLFRDFMRNRYPLTRVFAGELMHELSGALDIQVAAPVCIDIALRQKKNQRIVHFVNRLSGIPNLPNNGAIDEIPETGPITVQMALNNPPKSVRVELEEQNLQWRCEEGTLHATVERVHIHAALVVEL